MLLLLGKINHFGGGLVHIAEMLDRVYREKCKRTASGSMRDLDTTLSIDRSSAEYVYETVLQLAPANAVEVGMAWGFSSVPICAALRDSSKGVSTIFDPFQGPTYEYVGREQLVDFALQGHFWLDERRSDIGLPELFAGGHEIEFAFIDGDHRIDAVVIDFYYVNKMLKVGGMVIFDDLQFPSVQRVVSFALTQFHYERVDQPNARLAVLRRAAADDRGWGHYGDF